MGTYTDFSFNVELKEETDPNVIRILEALVNNQDLDGIENLPNHDFFKCDYWACVLGRNSDYYQFRKNRFGTLRHDKINSCYLLASFNNFKNYNNEIEKFLDWITPYMAVGYETVAGWFQCELDMDKERDAVMTIVFWNKDHFELNEVPVVNQKITAYK